MSGEQPTGLNPPQREAVEHGDGPLMVLAGAGSGKTRVLVHRIARLIEDGVPPHEILAVTFTNKAAGEMRARLREMMRVSAERMWIGTFHSTCARLLRLYGERIGLRRDFAIFDDDDQQRLLSRLLKEEGYEDSMTPRTLGSLIDRAKNRGQDPVTATADAYGGDVVRVVYPRYQQRLARENAVDFNDLLLKVLELADDAEVGPELSRRFAHVLVDEFQDTNLVQYRLVRHLVRGTRNLTVVGDDDQSIYSWRGAEPRNLLDFDRDFPDARVVKLEQNYRSTAMILDAANAVISRNRDRHVKALWTEREGGDPILWEEAADERAEADFIARAITGLVAEEGRDWGDMAILYRTHAQSRVLEEQLRRHRIDYRIVGGVSFFQRREIKDALAYLRLMGNPAADSAFERIVNVPARGIGKTTLDRVRAHAQVAGLGLLDAARSCAHGAVGSLGAGPRRKLAAFIQVIDGLRGVQAAGASVAELLIQTVERTGYAKRLEIEDTPEARDRLANLAELVSMASDFDDETGGKGTLVDFDERIALSSANDSVDGRGTCVTMMTVHAAKGLEFPVVFLCGMEDGLFPSLRERAPGKPGDAEASMEEERRLAYVAITRAQDRLVLTSASSRRHWGEIRFGRPSRFLDDLPAECVAVRAKPARAPSVAPRAQLGGQRARGGGHDEFDQRAWEDDVPVIDLSEEGMDESDDEGLRAGATVHHAAFGTGRVVEAGGEGKERKLLIDFPSVGRKRVLARWVKPG
jgi:DNA helicase II / ATP-dependent DNA helicase PcrA